MWLLDTHTLIWALYDTSKLSPKVCEIFQDPGQEIFVSALSFWEISLKVSTNRMSLPPKSRNPQVILESTRQMGLQELPLESDLATSYHQLPMVAQHRDPFDRMLIWQAICGGYTLLSRDKRLSHYAEVGLKYTW